MGSLKVAFLVSTHHPKCKSCSLRSSSTSVKDRSRVFSSGVFFYLNSERIPEEETCSLPGMATVLFNCRRFVCFPEATGKDERGLNKF